MCYLHMRIQREPSLCYLNVLNNFSLALCSYHMWALDRLCQCFVFHIFGVSTLWNTQTTVSSNFRYQYFYLNEILQSSYSSWKFCFPFTQSLLVFYFFHFSGNKFAKYPSDNFINNFFLLVFKRISTRKYNIWKTATERSSGHDLVNYHCCTTQKILWKLVSV